MCFDVDIPAIKAFIDRLRPETLGGQLPETAGMLGCTEEELIAIVGKLDRLTVFYDEARDYVRQVNEYLNPPITDWD